MHWILYILLVLLILLALIGSFVIFVIACFLCSRCRRGKPPSRFTAPQQQQCGHIPAPVSRRPDPFIYSQQYLMSLGLAVTWQNPDVHLEFGGVVVDSSDLKPATQYEVIARIWNNSIDAPVVNMPVNFYYLTFGVTTIKTYIGTTHINLSVKGAPGCPTFAHQMWTTPSQPGHYCLVIELIWVDDSNPANNVGQHNTQVKKLNSPRAAFTFRVRNATRERAVIRFEMDAYEIPARPNCQDLHPSESRQMLPDEVAQHKQAALAANNRDNFPIPLDWQVALNPAELILPPEAEQDVTANVTAPNGFVGRQAINVHAFQGKKLLGGVTLYAES